MATGTVKWFNHAKGFGFIRPEDGEDLFVHVTNVDDVDKHRIADDDPVEFEVRPGRKGQEAYGVRLTVGTLRSHMESDAEVQVQTRRKRTLKKPQSVVKSESGAQGTEIVMTLLKEQLSVLNTQVESLRQRLQASLARMDRMEREYQDGRDGRGSAYPERNGHPECKG